MVSQALITVLFESFVEEGGTILLGEKGNSKVEMLQENSSEVGCMHEKNIEGEKEENKE